MSARVSGRTEVARENARRTDGRFGKQHYDEPTKGVDALGTSEETTDEFGRTEGADTSEPLAVDDCPFWQQARNYGKQLGTRHGADLWLSGSDTNVSGKPYVTVSNIAVPEDKRKQGVGTAVMTELVAEADRRGWTLALTPSDEFGVSKTKLTAWYRRFGFVPRKGRNYDPLTHEAMIRKPQESS